MGAQLILAKTEKGRDEIRTRAHRIDNQLRRILLLIDDRSSLGQLKEKVPVYRDLLDDTVSQLIRGGFVVEVDSDSAATMLADEADQAELMQLKEALFALIEQMLGEGPAVNLRSRIGEEPKSRYELRSCFDNCVRMVRLTIDEAKAEVLAREGRRLLQ